MRNNFQMDGFAKDFFDGCYTLFKRATQLKLNKKRPRYSGGGDSLGLGGFLWRVRVFSEGATATYFSGSRSGGRGEN